MKRLIVFFGIVAALSLTSFNRLVAQDSKISKVVIDAGHGGKDPGCLGSKMKEKDVTLSIALKLGALITKNFPEIKVVYTRKTDVFVELFKRAEIANDEKADLFISIHCNANPSKTPYGTETFVMGLHKSQANLAVAQQENASILMEDSSDVNYSGFDPASAEAYIVFSLYQNAFLDQSSDLATKVQEQMKTKVGMYDRGVKQAGFLVLYKTYMPSILIENGFLSNDKDEAFLSEDSNRDIIAQGIFRAFKSYKSGLEKKTDTTAIKNVYVKDTSKTSVVTIKDTLKKKDIVFKVQFAASSVKKEPNVPEFKGLKNVQSYFQNGMYKYVTGNESSLEAASILLTKVQEAGFKDAFVVAFLNGERISAADAVRLIKKN